VSEIIINLTRGVIDHITIMLSTLHAVILRKSEQREKKGSNSTDPRHFYFGCLPGTFDTSKENVLLLAF
jgi:hypothetical protein